MHIESEILIEDLPTACVEECSRPGPADDAVRRWRAALDLTVDRARAVDGLDHYGAWTREELDAKSDADLAETVLWLACGAFAEGDDLFTLD